MNLEEVIIPDDAYSLYEDSFMWVKQHLDDVNHREKKYVYEDCEIRPLFVLKQEGEFLIGLDTSSQEHWKDYVYAVKVDNSYVLCDKVKTVPIRFDFPIIDKQTGEFKKDAKGNFILKPRTVVSMSLSATDEQIKTIHDKYDEFVNSQSKQENSSLKEEILQDNVSKLYKLFNAEVNELNVIISANTEDREVPDKEAYEKAKSFVESGIKCNGMWQHKEQPDSFIVKCDLEKAKQLAKDLCQKEFITVLFRDENTLMSKVFATNDDDYSTYEETYSSDKVVLGDVAKELDGYTILGDTVFSLGLYGTEVLDQFATLTEDKKDDTINEEVKDMHKLTLDNCKKQTWFEYYLEFVCSDEQEVRDTYGDEVELEGIANYYADVLDNGKKICALNYANFDGMGSWAELGVNDIQSDDLLKALESLGYEADCNDVECELGHPKSLEFKENSECEEVFAPFVKDIEDAMNGKKEESLKEDVIRYEVNDDGDLVATNGDNYLIIGSEEDADISDVEKKKRMMNVLNDFKNDDAMKSEYDYWMSVLGESLKEEDKSELYKLVQELRNYLWDTEKVSYEIWDDPQDNSINADIEWGDWKHDHLWFDHIAEKWLNEKGYEVVSFNTDVTEEDGSDTYSALHTLKIAKKQ